MNVLRRPSDFLTSSYSYLDSPQSRAISGQQMYLPREQYIEYMAENMLPAWEQARYEREMIEEQQDLAEQANRQASRDAMVSLGIQGIQLGSELGAGKYLKKAGSTMLSRFGATPAKSTSTFLAPSGQLASEAALLSEEAGATAASTVLPKAAATSAIPYPGAERAASGALPQTASIGSKILPGIGVASAGLTAGQGYGYLSDRYGWSKKLGKALPGGRKEWDTAGGAIAGAGAGAAMGSFVPVIGTGVGAVIGGLMGALGVHF